MRRSVNELHATYFSLPHFWWKRYLRLAQGIDLRVDLSGHAHPCAFSVYRARNRHKMVLQLSILDIYSILPFKDRFCHDSKTCGSVWRRIHWARSRTLSEQCKILTFRSMYSWGIISMGDPAMKSQFHVKSIEDYIGSIPPWRWWCNSTVYRAWRYYPVHLKFGPAIPHQKIQEEPSRSVARGTNRRSISICVPVK